MPWISYTSGMRFHSVCIVTCLPHGCVRNPQADFDRWGVICVFGLDSLGKLNKEKLASGLIMRGLVKRDWLTRESAKQTKIPDASQNL